MKYVLYIILQLLNFAQALSIPIVSNNETFIAYSKFFILNSLLLPIISYSASNIFQKRYAYADTPDLKSGILSATTNIIIIFLILMSVPSVYMVELFFPNSFSYIEKIIIVISAFLVVMVEITTAKFRVELKERQIVTLLWSRIIFENIFRIPLIYFFVSDVLDLLIVLTLSFVPTLIFTFQKEWLKLRITGLELELIIKNFPLFVASAFGVFILFADKVVISERVDELVFATILICSRFANAMNIIFTKTFSMYLQGEVYTNTKNRSQAELKSYFEDLRLKNLMYSTVVAALVYFLSMVVLKIARYYGFYNLDDDFALFLFGCCIASFLNSLNFTASYILTSDERFFEFGFISVVVAIISIVVTSCSFGDNVGSFAVFCVIILPAAVNFVLLNLWIVVTFDSRHIKLVVLALLPVMLGVLYGKS